MIVGRDEASRTHNFLAVVVHRSNFKCSSREAAFESFCKHRPRGKSDQNDHDGACEREERSSTQTQRHTTEWTLDESPRENSKHQGKHKFNDHVESMLREQRCDAWRGDGAYAHEDAHLLQDYDWPVPQIQRVRDQSNKHDRAPREQLSY